MEGSSVWSKVTSVFRRRRRPPQLQDNGEVGKVKSREASEEPLSLEEMKCNYTISFNCSLVIILSCILLALVRGEGGKLVEQVGNPTECALIGNLILYMHMYMLLVVSSYNFVSL